MAARVRNDGFVDPCISTLTAKPPSGPDWVHEIKHDGYRLIVRRDGSAVRLFTRRGYDWTDRYPAIATAAAKLRASSFTCNLRYVFRGALLPSADTATLSSSSVAPIGFSMKSRPVCAEAGCPELICSSLVGIGAIQNWMRPWKC
jgi:hypothetical protein